MSFSYKPVLVLPVMFSLNACLGGDGNGSDTAAGFAASAAKPAPVMAVGITPANLTAANGNLTIAIDGTGALTSIALQNAADAPQVAFTDPPAGSIGNFNVYTQNTPLAGFTDPVALIASSETHQLDYAMYGVWAESDALGALLSTGSTTLTGLGMGGTYAYDDSPTALPPAGSATYAGEAIAIETDTTGPVDISTVYRGSATLAANFGSNVISTNLSLMNPDQSVTRSFSGTGTMASGGGLSPSTFSGNLIATDDPSYAGSTEGHILGMTQTEVVGTFSLRQGIGDVSMEGAFGATR